MTDYLSGRDIASELRFIRNKVEKQLQTSVLRKAAKRAKKNNDRSLKKPLALDKKHVSSPRLFPCFTAIRPFEVNPFFATLRLCAKMVFQDPEFIITESVPDIAQTDLATHQP